MNSSCAEPSPTLQAEDLIAVFNQTFGDSHGTQLLSGGDEPIYLPADRESSTHRIIFTKDYAASALHEIAHWLVAGETRRMQVDYGYWYAPDGRSVEQQRIFEKVEVMPQAIEWLLSVAAGRSFRVSADNLEAGLGASQSFKDAIYRQTMKLSNEGVSNRCAQLIDALELASGVRGTLRSGNYSLELLQ